MWFSNMVDTYDSQNLEELMFKEFEKNDDSLNEFMLHLLQKADINIITAAILAILRMTRTSVLTVLYILTVHRTRASMRLKSSISPLRRNMTAKAMLRCLIKTTLRVLTI